MNMMHWVQSLLQPVFDKFDYGSATLNIQHYGQPTPPSYNLSLVDIPVALFSGSHDYLADPIDVDTLVQQLPPETIVFQDIQDDFAHLDFTWAPSCKDRIYNKIVDLLSQYSPVVV